MSLQYIWRRLASINWTFAGIKIFITRSAFQWFLEVKATWVSTFYFEFLSVLETRWDMIYNSNNTIFIGYYKVIQFNLYRLLLLGYIMDWRVVHKKPQTIIIYNAF